MAPLFASRQVELLSKACGGFGRFTGLCTAPLIWCSCGHRAVLAVISARGVDDTYDAALIFRSRYRRPSSRNNSDNTTLTITHVTTGK